MRKNRFVFKTFLFSYDFLLRATMCKADYDEFKRMKYESFKSFFCYLAFAIVFRFIFMTNISTCICIDTEKHALAGYYIISSQTKKQFSDIISNSLNVYDRFRFPIPIRTNYKYVEEVFVEEEYRNTEVSYELLRKLYKYLKPKKHVGAFCISAEGERMCKYLGMKNIYDSIYVKG